MTPEQPEIILPERSPLRRELAEAKARIAALEQERDEARSLHQMTVNNLQASIDTLSARERQAKSALTTAQQQVAGLIGVIKEYVEADVTDGLVQERLKAANDRADVLYRQWEAAKDDAELAVRRRENLEDCLRLADEAAQSRRRRQAARKALDATLTDAALAPPATTGAGEP